MKLVSNQPNFSVSTAVTSLSILNLISTPAMQLLLAIPMGAQAVGGFSRIQKFLQESETPMLTTSETSNSTEANDSPTAEKNAGPDPTPSAQHPRQPLRSYPKGNEQPDLPPVHFTANSITAITGPIGCGKSTVLRSLLSPDRASELCLSPSTDIAYCSQTPWIYEGTIRDNIVGQEDWEDKWYRSVVRACELDVDLISMPEGDSTGVGSKGSKLSGGQRQRIVSYES